MKRWFPALVFLLLLFCSLSSGCLSGVNAYFFGEELENPFASVCDSPAAEIGYLSSGSLDRDHCYQQVAVTAGDTSLCQKVERDPPMTKCYLLIASKKNEPAICDQIPPTNDMQAYLKVDCLWEVAMKNNNPAACDAMGSQRISRMIIGEMSKQTCNQRLASGQAASGSLT